MKKYIYLIILFILGMSQYGFSTITSEFLINKIPSRQSMFFDLDQNSYISWLLPPIVINWAVLKNESNFYMLNGYINSLSIFDNSHTYIMGGRINNLLISQKVNPIDIETGTNHVSILCKNYNYNDIEKIITGTWINNFTFNIQLINPFPKNEWTDDPIDNINFIIVPEPTTILILGIGAIFLRKKVRQLK